MENQMENPLVLPLFLITVVVFMAAGNLYSLNKDLKGYSTIEQCFKNLNSYLRDIFNNLDELKKSDADMLREIREIRHILGSNTFQNTFDLTKKTRGWKGMWKVTPEQAELIKKDTRTHTAIAKEYNISRSRVGQIKSN